MSAALYRLVDGLGGVREVPVRVEGQLLLVGPGPQPRYYGSEEPPRLALMHYALSMRWPLAQILAPGEMTRAEVTSTETGRCAAVCRDVGAGRAGPRRTRTAERDIAAHDCAEAIGAVSGPSVADDPALDATDGAHPAWWRGHDHTAAQMTAALNAQRTRADAAEADRDALRRELDALRQTHAGDLARERERVEAAERECARFAAIVEGRPTLTPADIAAHALAHPVAVKRSANGWEPECAYGLWLAQYDTDRRPVLRADVFALGEDGHWSEDYGACGMPSIVWALPLDRTGRPTAWPVAAPDAATGQAGEGGADG